FASAVTTTTLSGLDLQLRAASPLRIGVLLALAVLVWLLTFVLYGLERGTRPKRPLWVAILLGMLAFGWAVAMMAPSTLAALMGWRRLVPGEVALGLFLSIAGVFALGSFYWLGVRRWIMFVLRSVALTFLLFLFLHPVLVADFKGERP